MSVYSNIANKKEDIFDVKAKYFQVHFDEKSKHPLLER